MHLNISRRAAKEALSMKINRVFSSIDTHTGGNPTRTITGGLRKQRQKFRQMQQTLRSIRQLQSSDV